MYYLHFNILIHEIIFNLLEKNAHLCMNIINFYRLLKIELLDSHKTRDDKYYLQHNVSYYMIIHTVLI